MCKWGTDSIIFVRERNHPDIQEDWYAIGVDRCIAEYVQMMNLQGIVTVGCCCGHGKAPGVVLVARKSTWLLADMEYDYHTFTEDIVEHLVPPNYEKTVEQFKQGFLYRLQTK